MYMSGSSKQQLWTLGSHMSFFMKNAVVSLLTKRFIVDPNRAFSKVLTDYSRSHLFESKSAAEKNLHLGNIYKYNL